MASDSTSANTPPPVSEERLRECIEANDDYCSHYGSEIDRDIQAALQELETARTTIAALRKEFDELRGKNSTKE